MYPNKATIGQYISYLTFNVNVIIRNLKGDDFFIGFFPRPMKHALKIWRLKMKETRLYSLKVVQT